MAKLAEHIDEIVMKQILETTDKWFSKKPKSIEDMYTSHAGLQAKKAIVICVAANAASEKHSSSVKCWDLEKQTQLSLAGIKLLNWPKSRMAIVAQLSGVYIHAGAVARC